MPAMTHPLALPLAVLLTGAPPPGAGPSAAPSYKQLAAAAERAYERGMAARDAGDTATAAGHFRTAAQDHALAAELRPDLAVPRLGYAFRAHEEMLKYLQSDAAVDEAIAVCEALLARLDATPAGTSSDVTRAEVQAQLDRLSALRRPPPSPLANTTSTSAPVQGPTSEPAPVQGTTSEPPAKGEVTAPTSDLNPELDRSKRRPLVLAGSTLLALGAGSFAAMTVGLVLGRRAERDFTGLPAADEAGRIESITRGHRANLLAEISGGLGGALVIGGAVLLALGLRRGPAPRVRVGPLLDRRAAMVSMTVKF